MSQRIGRANDRDPEDKPSVPLSRLRGGGTGQDLETAPVPNSSRFSMPQLPDAPLAKLASRKFAIPMVCALGLTIGVSVYWSNSINDRNSKALNKVETANAAAFIDDDMYAGVFGGDAAFTPSPFNPFNQEFSNTVPVPTQLVMSHNVPKIDGNVEGLITVSTSTRRKKKTSTMDQDLNNGVDFKYRFPAETPTTAPHFAQIKGEGSPTNILWKYPAETPTTAPHFKSQKELEARIKEGSPTNIIYRFPAGTPTTAPWKQKIEEASPTNIKFRVEEDNIPTFVSEGSETNIAFKFPQGTPTTAPWKEFISEGSEINLLERIENAPTTAPHGKLIKEFESSPVYLDFKVDTVDKKRPVELPLIENEDMEETEGSEINLFERRTMSPTDSPQEGSEINLGFNVPTDPIEETEGSPIDLAFSSPSITPDADGTPLSLSENVDDDPWPLGENVEGAPEVSYSLFPEDEKTVELGTPDAEVTYNDDESERPVENMIEEEVQYGVETNEESVETSESATSESSNQVTSETTSTTTEEKIIEISESNNESSVEIETSDSKTRVVELPTEELIQEEAAPTVTSDATTSTSTSDATTSTSTSDATTSTSTTDSTTSTSTSDSTTSTTQVAAPVREIVKVVEQKVIYVVQPDQVPNFNPQPGTTQQIQPQTTFIQQAPQVIQQQPIQQNPNPVVATQPIVVRQPVVHTGPVQVNQVQPQQAVQQPLVVQPVVVAPNIPIVSDHSETTIVQRDDGSHYTTGGNRIHYYMVGGKLIPHVKGEDGSLIQYDGEIHYQQPSTPCAPAGEIYEEDFRAPSGEDEAIYEIYYTNPLKTCGTVVEIGAGYGDSSKSYFFEKTLHWKSILIEANPHAFVDLSRDRPDSFQFNGAFCEGEKLTYMGDGKFKSDSETEIMSEVYSDTPSILEANFLNTEVPCISLQPIFQVNNINKVDIMYIATGGDALAVVNAMDWNVKTDIWVIELNGVHEDRDEAVRKTLRDNGYVKAEWDIQRWCNPQMMGHCMPNEVFLKKGYNPLPQDVNRRLMATERRRSLSNKSRSNSMD